MKNDLSDPYGDPQVYDILTSPGTEVEVVGLSTMARPTRPVHRRWRWLEPACGTGRYLREAQRHDVETWGFDASARMIRYADSKLSPEPPSRLWVADLVDFARDVPPRSIDFAFQLNNSLRHLGDDEAVLAHLEDMERCLGPDGLYAVGLDLRGGDEPITEDVWTARRDGLQVTQVVQYVPADSRTETVLSHLAIQRSRGTEHRDHVYRLRTYDAGQWTSLVAQAGWTVVDVLDEHGRSTRHAPFAYGIHLLRPPTANRR